MTTKHLLTGVAVVAALAFSAPVGAQVINPGNANPGGDAMGMPGPNPGGPALTPYSTGPAPAPSGRMPAGGRRTSGERIPPIMPATPSASDTTSATPPTHHHAHAHAHQVASHHPSRFPRVTGDNSANQLNQAELVRLQQGAPPMAPQMAPAMAPPPPSPGGGNAIGTAGPNPGGPGLTPYSGGAPQR